MCGTQEFLQRLVGAIRGLAVQVERAGGTQLAALEAAPGCGVETWRSYAGREV